jgi:hypothetical protein
MRRPARLSSFIEHHFQLTVCRSVLGLFGLQSASSGVYVIEVVQLLQELQDRQSVLASEDKVPLTPSCGSDVIRL